LSPDTQKEISYLDLNKFNGSLYMLMYNKGKKNHKLSPMELKPSTCAVNIHKLEPLHNLQRAGRKKSLKCIFRVNLGFLMKNKIIDTEAKYMSTTNSLRKRNEHHCFKYSNLGGRGSNQLPYQLG
jgi:hypothetical protein